MTLHMGVRAPGKQRFGGVVLGPRVRAHGTLVVWTATVLWLLAPLIVGLGPRFQELVQVCTAACEDQAVGVVDQEQASLLADLGFRLPLYASLDIAREVALALASVVIGTRLVLRLRSVLSVLIGLTIVATGAVLVPEAPIAAERAEALPHVVLNMMILTALLSVGVLFLLLPDGRWVPSWPRALTLSGAGVLGLVLMGQALNSVDADWVRTALLISLICVGLGAQWYRYRRSSTDIQRQQLKWFGTGLCAWVATLAFYTVAFDGFLPSVRGETGYPAFYLALGFILSSAAAIPMLAWSLASLRHRLWDVEYILSRAALTTVLTVLAIGTYFGTTLAVTAAASSQVVLAAPFASLILVLGFIPAHARVSRTISRLLYGERDAPYELLTNLWATANQRHPNPDTLAVLTGRLVESLHLSAGRIEVTGATGVIVDQTIGSPIGTSTSIRLESGSEEVGSLTMWPRRGESALHARDVQLIANASAPIAHLASTVRLTGDLRRSQASLVNAHEQERRRIHRDLHDDLGPTLAGQALLLDAAASTLHGDPSQAAQFVDLAHRRADELIHHIRRLSHDLRPSALDQLGLAAALRRAASVAASGDVQVDVNIGELGDLSVATETAVYRIITEALANAIRHSDARSIRVEVQSCDGVLTAIVADDGRGGTPTMLDGDRLGMGLPSMHRRADELGGTVQITSHPNQGTVIELVLPRG